MENWQVISGVQEALSLYLFVIYMNVLSKMLDETTEKKKIGYHPRCKNINTSVLDVFCG